MAETPRPPKLWNASALKLYAVHAKDGPLGTIRDLLFDDLDWKLRWLVLETGTWLSGRDVLLPLSALEPPDPSLHQFPVHLTMQQISAGPPVQTDLPVSRQIEERIFRHFGWDPYWAAPTPPDEPAIPPGDPHLRSTTEVTGYHIHATDGDIGHISDFLVAITDWSIRYITVDTGSWWPGQKVLIARHSLQRIDWTTRSMHVDIDRKTIQQGPPYDPTVAVDADYDETLMTYFGIKWVTG